MLLLVMTDGRIECLTRAIESVDASVQGEFAYRVIHDDTGDKGYRRELQERYPEFTVIGQNSRQGFGGAIRSAWTWIRRNTDSHYIFHMEDDFVFNETVWLSRLSEILDTHPYIAQLAFKRQPWNDKEIAAGGIIEQDPDAFTDFEEWCEHRKFFTTNPCIYRRALLDIGWPDGLNSEGMFGIKLLENPQLKFAFYGKKFDPPKVTHIGDKRVGKGY